MAASTRGFAFVPAFVLRSTKAAKQAYLMHLTNNMNSESDDADASDFDSQEHYSPLLSEYLLCGPWRL
jgi:hypothetical protein